MTVKVTFLTGTVITQITRILIDFVHLKPVSIPLIIIPEDHIAIFALLFAISMPAFYMILQFFQPHYRLLAKGTQTGFIFFEVTMLFFEMNVPKTLLFVKKVGSL